MGDDDDDDDNQFAFINTEVYHEPYPTWLRLTMKTMHEMTLIIVGKMRERQRERERGGS